MAKARKSKLTIEDALVPAEEHPYEIPENWCWTKINSVASVYTGNSINERIKSEKYEGQQSGLLFIATKDVDFDNSINYETNVRITDPENFKKAPANTALLCIEGGSAGRKIGFINQEVCFGNKLCAFASDKIEPKYIYYFLQSNAFIYQFNDKKHGLIGGVSVKDLCEIGIALPPIEEQKRIVEQIENLFSKLDEAKEKAQEVIDGYESRNASIYNDAFSGKLTAKWREQNNKASSWVVKRFDEVADIKSNLVDPIDYSDFPHIAPDNIEKRTGILLEYHTIGEDGVTSGKHRFYPGQILYSKIRPYLSKVVMVDFDGLCSADMYPIEAKENTKYLLYYMLSDEFLEQASSAGSRSVLPKINQKELSALKVRITTEEEQEEVVRALDYLLPMMQQARDKAIQVVESIEIMKKSILAKAFRGELGTNNPDEESAIELLKQILENN